jgi:hypothetical protein
VTERIFPQQLPYDPDQDAADGNPWSEADMWDLRNCLKHGQSVEQAAQFLCRAGSVEDVRRKAEELGLLSGPPAAVASPERP